MKNRSIRKLKAALALGMLAAILIACPVAWAQRAGINLDNAKSAVGLVDVFTPLVRTASKGTVVVRVQKDGVLKQVALGTVISDNGYVLTKGSEVLGYSMITVQIYRDGIMQEVDAKIVGYSNPVDLAMLKIDAKNLTPVSFADTRPPESPTTAPATAPATMPGRGGARGGRARFGTDDGGPIPAVAQPDATPHGAVRVEVGEWVATTEAGGTYTGNLYPKFIGVISTPRRPIAAEPGYLGISWLANSYDGSGARIMTIIPGSNAEKAGLKSDDVVTSINGKPTPDETIMRDVLHTLSRGETAVLTVHRDKTTLTIRSQLGGDPKPDLEEQEMMILSGQVNRRSGDFPAVYQHDSTIKPEDCGGPLVDLDGRVIGVNIARAGRTETYAIPADLIVPLIEPLKAGKLPPPSDYMPY